MYIVTHINTFYVCICYPVPWAEEPGELQSVGPQRVRHECDDDGTLYIHRKREGEREGEREGGRGRERERNLVKESYKMIWEKCDMFIT